MESCADFVPLPDVNDHTNIEMLSLGEDDDLHAGDGEELIDPRHPCVSITGLHKTYMLGIEGVAALRGVSIHVSYGEFVMILGTSGGGKTSMLNVMGTIDTPTRGSIAVCDTTITERTKDHELADLRLHKIGFVFQAFNLLPSLTARENVEVPMRLAGQLSNSDRRARAMELLQKVGLGDRADHKPSQLSGGEQQRVTIARSLANSPTLLLLDEPTGDLDSQNSDYVMEILTELNRGGMAMVMVTHDVALKQYAHRVINMYDGKVSHEEQIEKSARRQAHERLAATCVEHRNLTATQSETGGLQTEFRTRQDYKACVGY